GWTRRPAPWRAPARPPAPPVIERCAAMPGSRATARHRAPAANGGGSHHTPPAPPLGRPAPRGSGEDGDHPPPPPRREAPPGRRNTRRTGAVIGSLAFSRQHPDRVRRETPEAVALRLHPLLQLRCGVRDEEAVEEIALIEFRRTVAPPRAAGLLKL